MTKICPCLEPSINVQTKEFSSLFAIYLYSLGLFIVFCYLQKKYKANLLYILCAPVIGSRADSGTHPATEVAKNQKENFLTKN